MSPILILGFVAGLYLLLQHQHGVIGSSANGAVTSGSLAEDIASGTINKNSAGIISAGSNPGNFSKPAAPSNIGTQTLGMGSMAATTGLGLLLHAGMISSLAAGAATLGIGAIVAIAGILLAKHAARIKGATNENTMADAVVPSYDATLLGIADAYNRRNKNDHNAKANTISALQQLDQITFQHLKSLVGPPGTHWRSKGNGGPATTFESTGGDTPGRKPYLCDKGCTVGCCIYYNSLAIGIENVIDAVNGRYSRWDKGDLGAQVRRDLGAYIPRVGSGSSGAGSQYSHYERDAYWIKVS